MNFASETVKIVFAWLFMMSDGINNTELYEAIQQVKYGSEKSKKIILQNHKGKGNVHSIDKSCQLTKSVCSNVWHYLQTKEGRRRAKKIALLWKIHFLFIKIFLKKQNLS